MNQRLKDAKSPLSLFMINAREWKAQLFMIRDFGWVFDFRVYFLVYSPVFAKASFKLRFIAEDMMVVLRKPVGLVSHAL